MNDKYIVKVFLMNGKAMKSEEIDKSCAKAIQANFQKNKMFDIDENTTVNPQFVVWLEVVEAVKSKIIRAN